jgi:cytochrome P450
MDLNPAEIVADALCRLMEPASRAAPYPLYARIREIGPVWQPDANAVVVSGYRDCETLLRDPRLSAQRGRALRDRLMETLPSDAPSSVRQPWFLSLDPPDHTRLRRLVAKAFTARAVARLEAYVTELTDDMLDAAAGSDHWDVLSGLAYPLPLTVICRLLGVPLADEPLFRAWSISLTRLFDGFGDDAPTNGAAPEWLTAMVDIHRYLTDLVDTRRGSTGEDLISELLTAEHEGDSLTTDELVSTVVLLLVAGHETTVNLIANGVLALLRNPRYLQALRTDPDTALPLVEEVLRYDPPVQFTARVLTEDAEVCGVPAPKGALVYLLLAAAHRDPREFTEPDRFMPERPDAKHLAFGLGAHYCLGAPLARLEARIALSRFAARMIDPVSAQDPPPYREHVNLRGPRAVPVRHHGVRPLQERGASS